jgi:hypothetical protein
METYINTMQEDESNLIIRIEELQKTYNRVCLAISFNGQQPGDVKIDHRVRERVEEIVSRFETLIINEQTLQ